MKEWLMEPNNRELIKTILIASGFGIGFFVMKGLKILKFPFELLFQILTTKITFNNSTWDSEIAYKQFSKKIANSKKWFYRSFLPVGYASTHESRRGNLTSIGQGWFFCMLDNRLAFIRTTEFNKDFGQHMVSYVIWFTRDNRRVNNLMRELKEVSDNGFTINYLTVDGLWTGLGQRNKRSMESVFYTDEIYKNLENHYNDFHTNKQHKDKLGLLNKSVKLFYGPPGTGKTSLASVLASKYDKDIYIINTANVGDDIFIKSIYNIPDFSKAIIVFEDIDNNISLYDRSKYIKDSDIIYNDNKLENIATKGKTKLKSSPTGNVSLNTMLNFLDGFLTPNNVDVIITTNHLEKLDPALYRSSRVNLLQEIGYVNKDICKRFIEYHYEIKLNNNQLKDLDSLKDNLTCSYLTDLKTSMNNVNDFIKTIIN